ncbi:MAG: tRNA lysidine(34) synthetase TilS [Vicinamibacterales bacterium]
MTNLAARVRRFAAREGLWPRGARVVAAVSGGGDSVALVLLLAELAAAGDLVLAGLVHLNHQLRPTADRDEALCRALAESHGVPIDAARRDVAAAARAGRRSTEVTARDLRYALFEEARVRRAAEVTAVAHTRDDQAETVLFRLLRGTGPQGLRGMRPRRDLIARPLLACGRDELRRYLAARGASWSEDETNADPAIPRNRIRHELLPQLTRLYQPALPRVLARLADLAAADDEVLAAAADTAAARLSSEVAEGWRLDTQALAAAPPAIAHRVVRGLLARAGAARAVRVADVDRVLAACRTAQARPVRVAGVLVERFSADAVLFNRGGIAAAASLPPRMLEVPGLVEVPECGAGWRLRAEGPIKQGRAPAPSRHRLLLDAGTGSGPFTVRGRRAGDRIRPAGAGGSKSLQDLFVDRKVPRALRARVPDAADAAGRILWVVGVAVAEGAAAPAGAGDVVVLNFERPASPGPEAT